MNFIPNRKGAPVKGAMNTLGNSASRQYVGGTPRQALAPASRFGNMRFSEIILGGMLILTSMLNIFQKIKMGSISANGLLTALYCLLIFFLLIMRGGISSRTFKVLFPALLLGLWTMTSVSWSRTHSSETIQPLTVLLSFIGALVLVSDMAERREPVRFWFISLIPKALALATILMLASLAISGGMHVQGAQLANRAYAIYAAVGVVWFMAGWRIGRLVNRTYTFLIIATIAASLSRTTFAACIVILPFMVFFRPRSFWGWVRPILFLALLGAFAVIAIFTVPALHKRFFSSGDRGVSVNGTTISTEGRAQIWAAVFKDAQKSPWIGQGPGSASIYVGKLTDDVVKEPHNDYLRLFHDYGIVGLFLWVWLIYSLCRTIQKGYKLAEQRNLLNAQRCIVTGLGVTVVTLICMLTDNILVYPQPMLLGAILLGIAIGTSLHLQADAISF